MKPRIGLMLLGFVPLPSPPRVPSPSSLVPAAARVILPPPCDDLDDDGDLPTLATQLDHEPEVTP